MGNDVKHSDYLKSKLSSSEDLFEPDFYAEEDSLVVGPNKGESPVQNYIDQWHTKTEEVLEFDDPQQILKINEGRLQANLLKIAFEASKGETRLSATKYALEQAGLGGVKNLNVTHNYDTLPTEQLLALLKNKTQKIQKSLPNVNLKEVLGIVDAEYEEIEDEKILLDR